MVKDMVFRRMKRPDFENQQYRTKIILKKKAWTNEEDKKLIDLVKKNGPSRWSQIASMMKDRVGK